MRILNKTVALAFAWAFVVANLNAQAPPADDGSTTLNAGTFMLTNEKETPWTSSTGEKGTLPSGVMVMIIGAETNTLGRFRIPEHKGDVQIEGKYLIRMPEELRAAWSDAQKDASIPASLFAVSLAHLQSEGPQQMLKMLFIKDFEKMVESGDVQNALNALDVKVREIEDVCGRGHLLGLQLQYSALTALTKNGLPVQTLAKKILSATRQYFFAGDAIRMQIALGVANGLSRSGAVGEAVEIVDTELPDAMGGHPRLILPWAGIISEIYTRAGRSGKALSLRQQVLMNLMEENHSEYQSEWYQFLNLTARSFQDVGKTELAESLYEAMLEELSFPEKTEEKFRIIAAVAADNLSEILSDRGQFERALALNAAAIRIFKDTGDGAEGALATSCRIRSRIIFIAIQNKAEAGRMQEMLDHNAQATRYFIQAAGGQASAELAGCLHLRGEILQFMGSVMATDPSRLEEAKRYFAESLKALRIAMNQRAALTGSLGVPPTFQTVNRFTESAVQAGEISEAVTMSTAAAMQRVDDILKRAAFATYEESEEIFGGDTQELMLRALSLGLPDADNCVVALRTFLNYKARQTEVRAAAWRLANRADLLSTEQRRTLSRELLQNLRNLNAAESVVAYTAVENREAWNRANSNLTREALVQLQDLYGTDALAEELKIFEPPALLGSIPPRSVFVDYTITHPTADNKIGGKKFGEGYFSAIVYASAGQPVEIILLAPVRTVVSAVERLRKACRLEAIEESGDPATAAREAMSAAREVSGLIWDPVAKKLADVEQVIISPEGDLWFVPWAALPGKAADFLIEERSIRLVMSGRDVAAARPAPARTGVKGAPLVLAAPNFNADQSQAWRTLRGTALPAENLIETVGERDQNTALKGLAEQVRTGNSILPRAQALANARPEAEAIIAPLRRISGNDPVVWTGEAALEPALAEYSDSPQILVFITHGFAMGFDSPDGTSGSSASGTGQRSAPRLPRTGSQNPLINCGLLLAGCNARGNLPGMRDGVLTGQEVLGLNLQQTELVVLSACETGLGALQGSEGVAGLRQAFQLAGARNVLATLWTVDDLESKNLMVDFFENYADSRDAARALRAAQLKRVDQLKKKWGAAHPYFWAAATVTGPPDVRK
jgi:CHAT domain-containing protein